MNTSYELEYHLDAYRSPRNTSSIFKSLKPEAGTEETRREEG
jgi:hypothetical protein